MFNFRLFVTVLSLGSAVWDLKAVSPAQGNRVDFGLAIALVSQSACSDFPAYYEARLLLRMDYTNRLDSPITVYFKDLRELQLAVRRSDLIEGKPDRRLGGDRFPSPAFRGARYDIGPAGPGGLETRLVTEVVPVARKTASSAFVRPGRYFLRIVEQVETPLDPAQRVFSSLRLISDPIEVSFPEEPELSPCSA